eukprot:5557486-Amphidinium_carterae.2
MYARELSRFLATGTNSPPRTLTSREEYQQEVPNYQKELSMELERVYGADWKTLRPQGQGDPYADQQAELQTLRMQTETLLRETIDRKADLRKFLSEHAMQTESMQEVIRTLDATRAEQQELYLKIEENKDELVQLCLRLKGLMETGRHQVCQTRQLFSLCYMEVHKLFQPKEFNNKEFQVRVIIRHSSNRHKSISRGLVVFQFQLLLRLFQ